MGSLRDVTFGEVVEALARYRPVAVTVAVILVALWIVPAPDLPSTRPTGFGPDGDSAATGGALTTPTTAPGDVSGGTLAPSSSSSFDFSSTPSDAFPSPSSSSFGSSPGSPEPGSFGDFGEPTNTDQDRSGIEARLRVVDRAYASRTAGTPLASDGVPAGSMPVGTRVGQDDKLSFARLEGTDKVLVLAENPAGARSTSGPAAIRACQVTEADWTEGDAIAIADAPAYDASKCVEGTRAGDGTWSFDLTSFPTPTDRRGIALVPGEAAGIDFQVALVP